MIFRRTAVALLIAELFASCSAEAEPSTINMVGEQRYRVPLSYRPVKNGTDGISILVSFPNFGPLVGDKPGWQDNAQILVEKQINTLGMLWDQQWDGTPVSDSVKSYQIEKKYRIEPEFTVQEMGSGFDLIIPDQDLEKFPLGVFQCYRPSEMPFPSCSYLFDVEKQRWKITIGRQFIKDFRNIRERAVARVNSFKKSQVWYA